MISVSTYKRKVQQIQNYQLCTSQKSYNLYYEARSYHDDHSCHGGYNLFSPSRIIIFKPSILEVAYSLIRLKPSPTLTIAWLSGMSALQLS